VESVREFCIFSVPVFHECVLFIAASIIGPPEQYVHQGSTVTLTCLVPAPYSYGKRPPRIVDWFHSDRLVSIQVQLQHMESLRHISYIVALSGELFIYLKQNIQYMHVRSVLLHFIYFVYLCVLPFFLLVFPLVLPSFLSFIS